MRAVPQRPLHHQVRPRRQLDAERIRRIPRGHHSPPSYGPAMTFARYCARTPLTVGSPAGETSVIVSVGATLYVTVIDPAGGIRNVPVVRPVGTPPTAITVTCPPVVAPFTGTGFRFTDATLDP